MNNDPVPTEIRSAQIAAEEAAVLETAGVREAAALDAEGKREADALRVAGQRNINIIKEEGKRSKRKRPEVGLVSDWTRHNLRAFSCARNTSTAMLADLY